jgi:hypothetical protein
LVVAVALAFLVVATPATATAASSPGPRLTTLQPGQFRTIEHPLDVNVVFVGYASGTGAGQVDINRFLAALPAESRPHVRDPAFYGTDRDLGLHFTYRYHVTDAPPPFEDAFFSFLTNHGTPGAPTLYQRLYNQQHAARRRIDSNLMIDAVDTQRWLGANAGSIGVDTRKDTIFFINWFGRADFRDHLYNKPGDVSGPGLSDALNDYGPGDAFGGTPADDPERPLGSVRRIWFYDASAAVDWVDSSWNVDDPAPSGGSSLSYRMPPIWEYGNPNGYRPFDDLTGDLAKLARYVAIDNLFTPSPLYDPAITAPKLPSKIEVDLTGLSAVPGQKASSLVQGPAVLAKLAPTEPYNTFSYEATDRRLTGQELDVYKCFHSAFTVNPQSCYGDRLDPSGFADLFLWIDDHLHSEFVEGHPDLEIPTAVYDVPDQIGTGRALLGITWDDFTTGLQTYVNVFSSPGTVQAEKPVDFALPTNLSFTPTDPNHFAVDFAPAHLDPTIGDDLHLGDDDTTEVALPFSFPYLGASYSSIHVNSNGNITFGVGDPMGQTGYSYELVGGPPRLAALMSDLNPSAGGSVDVSVRSDSVVVTWSHVPVFGDAGTDTFQVTLARDGRITYGYGELNHPFGFVGVARGANAGPTTTVDFTHDLPRTFAVGAAYESFSSGVTLDTTETTTHEVGHYIGLSHPHDGYDWETGLDFFPGGDFFFAWEGDYSDTVMSYFAQQTDFSQFDRDALDRDMTSIYINESNNILSDVYATGEANQASSSITSADRHAADALRRLARMDYRGAAVAANAAYLDVVAAAAQVGVTIQPRSASAAATARPAARTSSGPVKGPLTDPRAEDLRRR